MLMLKKYLSFSLALALLLGVVSVFSVPAAEGGDEPFEISNVYARTGADGAFKKDALAHASNGFNRNVNMYGDRANIPCTETPDMFINCGYILSTYAGIAALQKPDVLDVVKFDINKSATVYLVNWTKDTPNWINEYGWKSSDFTGLQGLYSTGAYFTVSGMLYEKHFDVTAPTLTISLGGVNAGRYFSVFVKEDNLIQEKYPLSEDEIKNPNLYKNLIGRMGESVIMFQNSGDAYVNGRKYQIDDNADVAPVVEAGEAYVPLRFLAESLGGGVMYDEQNSSVQAMLNRRNYSIDLNTNKMTELASGTVTDLYSVTRYGRTMLSLSLLAEVAELGVYSRDGLIVIGPGATVIDEALADKIKALFVTPVSALDIRLKYAVPGDVIYIADGKYSNVYINVKGEGTEEKPITVKSQSPGGVEFTGNFCMDIKGTWMVVDGFYFNRVITTATYMIGFVGGSVNNRLTNCFFDKCRASSLSAAIVYMTNHSVDNRVDHCAFQEMESITHIIQGVLSPEDDGKVYGNRFDHNYYNYVAGEIEAWMPARNYGPETFMNLGPTEQYNTVEYNLFENIIGDRGEIISNKSHKNTYRYNTFLNNYESGMTLRGGKDAMVYGNFFINGKTGLRVYDSGHVIFNNYFYNMYRDSIRLPSVDANNYAILDDVIVANNTIVNPGFGGIIIGEHVNLGSETSNITPRNMTVANNLILTSNGHGVRNYASENLTYKNNIVKAIGNGEDRDANELATQNDDLSVIEKAKEIEIAYDGELFRPKDSDSVMGKGIPIPEIAERTGLDISELDIGILNPETAAQGVMTVEKVGPENKWWLENIRIPPADFRDMEPEENPYSYTPSSKNIYIPLGENFALAELAGYASYAKTGKSYDVNAYAVQYKILEGEEHIRLNGDVLEALSVGDAKLCAIYKEHEIEIDVRVIPVAEGIGELYRNNFDTEKEMSRMTPLLGTWDIDNGRLKTQNVTTQNKEILDNSIYFKGDYKISCDIKASGVNEGAADAFLVIGEVNNSQHRINPTHANAGHNIRNVRYLIRMRDSGEYTWSNKGIYMFEALSQYKIGDILVDIEPNRDHHIELTSKNGVITLLIDGAFAGIADVGGPIEGRIGFGSLGGSVEFDNVVVTGIDKSDKASEKKAAGIDAVVTDLNIMDVKVGGFEDRDDVIYKWTINDVFRRDSIENTFNGVWLNHKGDFNYTVDVYDKDGNVIGAGEKLYDGPHQPDGLFYITNVMAKNGMNETYNTEGIRSHNNGLTNGVSYFSDRLYVYANVPSEFENAAYIRPSLNFRTAYLRRDELYDWLKFDIHNKSATVYVGIYASKTPGWIYDQRWNVTPFSLGFLDSTGKMNSTSYVYKKHFDVPEDGKTTVVLGGIGAAAAWPYCVIIVPDKD